MTTDTTVIQPGAGQSILTTDHHHDRHRGYDDNCHRELRTDADYRSIIAQGERYGTINGDRINTSTQVTGDRVNAAAAAAALAACRTNELVQGGFGGVHDRLCDATGKVVGALDTGFTAAALAACKTQDEVAAVYANLQKQISDAATATVVGFKDAQATAYQIEGRTQLDAAKNVATLGLQATTNANALSVEATKNFYALSVEATKNADAAQLEAQKNAAAVAMQVAECCCELKALITAESTSTRALINTNTIEGLRAQLVATQRLIPVTIPVGAG